MEFNDLLLPSIPGQGSWLHVSIFVSLPKHSLPPLTAAWIIVRFAVLFPPPHVSEHSDQSLNNDHVQFTEEEKA